MFRVSHRAMFYDSEQEQAKGVLRVKPARYGEAADMLADLPAQLKATRDRLGMSLREVAAESGVSFATICRVERGEGLSAKSASRLMRWLGSK